MTAGLRRRAAAAVAAIAFLALASVLAVRVLAPLGPARLEERPAPVEAAAPPPGPGGADPAAAPASSAPPAGLLATAPPQVVVDAPPPVPAAGSWEAVPVTARPGSLGPVGAALGRELNDLQPDLSACFDEDAQARHGTQPHTAVRDAAPLDDAGLPTLLLQVEASPGRLVIVDAPVEARGGASDGLLACAQRVLRGRSFDVPAARAGQRFRLLLSLSP